MRIAIFIVVADDAIVVVRAKEIRMSEERLERIEKKIDVLATGQAALHKEQRRMAGALEAHGTEQRRVGVLLEAQGKEQHRMGVLLEKLKDDIQGVAEGVVGLGERMDRGFKDVLARLDDRAVPIEAATRHLASKLADHERRLPKRPRRRRH